MSDASRVWSLDDLHLPGDGVSYDGPGTQPLAIRASSGGGNSIARTDNRIYRQPLADGDAAPVDGTTNRNRDGTAGSDEASDHDADTAMLRAEPAPGSALHLAHGDSDADGRTDVDAEPDYRAVPGESCGWGLPAALLFRAGE